MCVCSFESLPVNTAFRLHGNDMVKVRHAKLGFAARNVSGQTVVLTGKTPVEVERAPTIVMDSSVLLAALDHVHQMLN